MGWYGVCRYSTQTLGSGGDTGADLSADGWEQVLQRLVVHAEDVMALWVQRSYEDAKNVCLLLAHRVSLTRSSVDSMVSQFVTLYNADVPRFENLTDLTGKLGWAHITDRTTEEYFNVQGINPKWTRELVEGMTRVNYGQVSSLNIPVSFF